MNGSELELEQWSCSASPNKQNINKTSISKVLIGDTIAMKCEKESEGLLLFKRVEVKKENSRNGKSGSPDTGYESDNVCLRNELVESNSHFVRPEFTDFDRPSILGSLMVDEVKLSPKVITIKGDKSVEDEGEENMVLDLTTTTKNTQHENPISVTPLDYTLSPSDEINAIMNNEVESLIGVSVLESVIEARPPIDTILACSDGKLGTHRIVLTAASVFFYDLFISQRLEEIVVVILPDISKKTMTSLLHLAYTGQMVYTEDVQDDIFSAMECLFFGDLEKLTLFPCTVNKRQPPPPAADEIVIVASPEKDLKDNMRNYDDKISDRESSTEMTACTSNASTVKAKNKNKSVILTCPHCPRTFTKKGSLQIHTTKFHPEEYRATVGEMQMLSFCDICDRQYKTVSRAMFCYNQHGLTRCLNCLGVFPTTEIKDHYATIHANIEGDDLVVKCRWCSRAVSVKNNLTNISSHSSVHWPGASSGKRQQEPNKVAKDRKRTKNTASDTCSRKVTSLSCSSMQAFESEATTSSLKTSNEATESKKRHRSGSSEDDFNLSKTIKRNNKQYAKRTGKPVGRGGGLTMEKATVKAITNMQPPANTMFVVNHENPTKTKPMDITGFPKIVIKLDSIEKINKLMKKYRNRAKSKRSKGLDGNSKRKGNVEHHATPDKIADNDSIQKINDTHYRKEELVKETGIFYAKEIKGKSYTYLTKAMDSGKEDANSSENIKVLNSVLEKTEESSTKTGHNLPKLTPYPYPMSYFPARFNQPPIDDRASKCLPVNSISSKENCSVPSWANVEKSSTFSKSEYDNYAEMETVTCATSAEESSLDMP